MFKRSSATEVSFIYIQMSFTEVVVFGSPDCSLILYKRLEALLCQKTQLTTTEFRKHRALWETQLGM